MPPIKYSVAWRKNDARLVTGAKAFWAELGFSQNLVEGREKELCAVAEIDGRVIGVTTVVLSDSNPLKCYLGFLRCAVSPDFRKHYLATFLTRNSLTIMEYWSLEHPDQKLQGLGFMVEADELGSKAIYPQWADWNTHYNLIGYTPHGAQMRLAWFRHAQLA